MLSVTNVAISHPQILATGVLFHEANSEDEKQFKAYLSCEHYSRQSRNHWAGFTVADGEYDLEYIAAVFTDDTEEIFGSRWQLRDTNMRVFCPLDHREDDQLVRKELCHWNVTSNFRSGIQSRKNASTARMLLLPPVHPYTSSPLPEKTPHGINQSILYSRFPDIQNPTLSHLHPSLANRNHLSAYISQVKKDHFPHGTDWKGVAHLKRLQDEHLLKRSITSASCLSLTTIPFPSTRGRPSSDWETTTRIIICMAPDASHRLKTAGYLQSDIGFKRIVGFHEFEIASMDRDANTSVIFCRIEQQLHGYVLHWGGDQHRGQAKGLGLHLVSIAATLPPDKMDLHEPGRTLRSLGPYDHLCHVFRLCKVHNYRNIEACAVPPGIKTMMCSLACIRHPCWDETIAQIIERGGKPALDWVRDKESSQFAFAGICWERSFIPLDIWKAGEPHTNLIETVHRDVNRREYTHYELHGIRPTYDSVSRETKAIRNLKRSGNEPFYFTEQGFTDIDLSFSDNKQARRVATLAATVEKHNNALSVLHRELENAMRELPLREQDLHNAPLVFPAAPGIGHKDVDRLTLKYNTQ
ncbi:hypothetical protein B0H13DRAFT_1936056 [Mycena leptocephala]|nr:hypothetical protein B0H13DRAFT_1936056 [Mycena leptocephala]